MNIFDITSIIWIIWFMGIFLIMAADIKGRISDRQIDKYIGNWLIGVFIITIVWIFSLVI